MIILIITALASIAIGLFIGLGIGFNWAKRWLDCMHHTYSEDNPTTWVQLHFFAKGTRKIFICSKCRKGWPDDHQAHTRCPVVPCPECKDCQKGTRPHTHVAPIERPTTP